MDFPFDAASDRAHALAGFLLPFVRRMIRCATPIHLVEAPTPGTGSFGSEPVGSKELVAIALD